MNDYVPHSAPLPAITLHAAGLTCRRGGHEILQNIHLDAAPGTLTLLRGPNGAGKSTLLHTIAGLLHYEGTLTWSGTDPEAAPHSHIHLIGHLPALKPALTLTENLAFWADMNGGTANAIAPALDAAGLGHIPNLETAILSAGQTRRLSLARLLVTDRPVWLLDEPTAALDNQGENWVCSLIAAHVKRGGMVIAATHLDLPVPAVTPHTVMLKAAT